MKRGGHEVGERFADACSGFDHQVPAAFERPRHRAGHVLLLPAEFKTGPARKLPVLRKYFADLPLECGNHSGPAIFPN